MTRRSLLHSAAASALLGQKTGAESTAKIRRSLAALPAYGCFDFLTFKLDGGTLTLGGYVVRATLKEDAAQAVRSIERVSKVENEIEVLPATASDDEVRWGVFRAIYRDPLLGSYAPGGPFFGGPFSRTNGGAFFGGAFERWSLPPGALEPLGAYPIHIVVKGGNVILVGVVDKRADSDRANLLANGVAGVLNVKNILEVDESQTSTKGEVWTFDRLDRIGGHPTQAFGTPRVVTTDKGKAVEFDGVEDALFIDNHPLSDARVFTWEVIFRPAKGGRPEQRFFHMQENGSTNRYLMETRLMGDNWCLDSFAATSSGQQALMDRTLTHPLDAWHHCALVYDGARMRHYVNGNLELSANVLLAPHGVGRTSVGVRFNQVDYFRGAIRLARMTRRALAPSEFLKA